MSTLEPMTNLFQTHASAARYFRSSGTAILCSCKTPEGFRDPELHLSLGSYGVKSYVISPGAIPANKEVAYTLLYHRSNMAPMSPAITYPKFGQTITDPANFQVTLTVDWPDGADGATRYDVFRADMSVSGTLVYIGQVTFPDTTLVDNLPAVVPPGSLPYAAPVLCNEAGEIPQNPVDLMVKAFVQPIQSTRATRLSTEYLQELFGNIEADDHLGIFPVNWAGTRLNFRDWSQSGDDFIEYDGQRFFVINSNMIPDPGDGNPEHHWELGLRMLRSDGLEN